MALALATPGQLGVEGLEGGVGVDAGVKGELAARLAAAGKGGNGALAVGVGGAHRGIDAVEPAADAFARFR